MIKLLCELRNVELVNYVTMEMVATNGPGV